MLSDSPDIATLYKCSLFKCCGKVKIIVFDFITAICIK